MYCKDYQIRVEETVGRMAHTGRRELPWALWWKTWKWVIKWKI